MSVTFDEERFVKEIVSLVFNKLSNKNKDINRIISEEFGEVFKRYFPGVDMSLDHSHLYDKVIEDILKKNNELNNIEDKYEKAEYMKQLKLFV